MALITNFQRITESGLTPSVQLPTAVTGDTFANSGSEIVYVKNGSGSSINVTIVSQGTCSFGLAANVAHDKVIAVAAGATKLIGPLDKSRFNDPTTLLTKIVVSTVTSVDLAILRA